MAALSLSGCATEPRILSSGHCTLLSRPGHELTVTIRTEYVKSVNAILEFPAKRFQDIALRSSDKLHDAGVEAIYLEMQEQAAAKPGTCVPTSADRQTCTLEAQALARSGFAVVAVAGKHANGEGVLSEVRSFWAAVGQCGAA